MSRGREWLSRLAAFVTRRQDPDLRDELQFHLEMTEDRLKAAGVDGAEARRRARLLVGGATQIGEAYGDQRSLPLAETLLQDARYGVRTLLKSPAFTLAALLTLALGVGANTAMFSIVHAVLLRPLPYAAPERLVVLGDRGSDGQPNNIGYTTFQDYRDRARSFDAMVAIRSWTPTLVAEGEAERVPALRVSWNFFAMLGVRPEIGRDFRADEDRPDDWRVVILGNGLWRRRFGGDPNVVGRTIRMNDVEYRIVGVMPADFEPLISARFYSAAELWAPLGYSTALPYACRSCQHLKALGRIRSGVTRDQAIAELNIIRRQLVAEHPTDYDPVQATAEPLHDAIAGRVRLPLLVLLGAVALVMLIACANVASLLLSRAVHRSREIAVRAALGAGRRRLVRQLLTESTMLGLAGGVAGLGLAAAIVQSVGTVAPVSIPRLDRAGLDGWVLAFTVGISIVTGLGFGIVPALRGSSSFRLRDALTSDARTGTTSGSTRARQLLIVGDLAVALVLLIGAGLMLRTVSGLMLVDPGFDPKGVLTAQFSLVGTAYREDSAVFAFQQRLLEKVRALPGVEAAAVAGQIPMGGNFDSWGFHIEGLMHANTAEDPSVQRFSVTPDYFRVMRIPLRRGRLITEADNASAPAVIVVSESAAQLWNGADPIGRRVRIGGPDGPWRTVVGVVGDVRHTSLDERASTGFYAPQAQVTDSFLVLTVKAANQPESLTGAVRGVVRSLDSAVPVYAVATLDELLSKSFADRRFVMRLLGAFSALAVLLAAIGLYGVVSYTVAQRRREMGVRVALGAAPSDILRLVVAGGLGTLAAGLGLGLIAALVLTRVLQTLLFGVGATDPLVLVAAVGALTLVAILAHWLPARRALAIDPAIALRQD
jgi:putative ABC transport system permease protein